MSVMCAWASANEYGKVNGGKAGDQTGKTAQTRRKEKDIKGLFI